MSKDVDKKSNSILGVTSESVLDSDQVLDVLFYNSVIKPPKVTFCSKKPSKVQESPLDAKSPQELMDHHGMYIDRPSLKELKPFYADLTSFDSFEEQLNHVRDLREKFMALDVSVRAKFNHSPEQFCAYLNSKDFDIREIMTSDVYEEYQREQKDIADRKAFEDYMKSDKYKKEQEELELRRKYEEEQYQNWKKNFKTT